MVIEIILQRMHFQRKHWQSAILSRSLVSLPLTRAQTQTHLNVCTIETLQDASLFKKLFGDHVRSV